LNCVLPAPPPPDFSCVNSPAQAAIDPLPINGRVVVQILGSESPGDGALVEAHSRLDNSLLTATMAAPDGTFSLSVPTGGVPFDGYLVVSKSGFVNTRAYWSRPLTKPTTGGLLLFDPTTLGAAYLFFFGTTQQANTGTLVFSAVDCAGVPISGATVSATPTGTLVQSGSGLPAAFAGTPLTAFMLNEPSGTVDVSATSGGTNFGFTTVPSITGQMTYVLLSP